MYLSIIAVGLGGARPLLAVLGLRLNALLPNLPLGTLASNVIAGYVIGVVAVLARMPDVPIEWRLFVITGLMGGLSTFSSFSAEVVSHLQEGRLGWAAGEIAIHVSASIVMTILGIATALARHALDVHADERAAVTPWCPAARAYIFSTLRRACSGGSACSARGARSTASQTKLTRLFLKGAGIIPRSSHRTPRR